METKEGDPQTASDTASLQTWSSGRISFVAVAIALIAGCSYLPILRHLFISFDDPDYVTENAHVKEGLHWHTFACAWTSLEHANWHPVTWISHAAAVQVFSLSPTGHHFVSLLLHAANAAALLFLVLFMLTRRPGCSVVVALLFAVHPLNVEPVAWIAERKSLLRIQ
jgi:hypothetical protein